MSNSVNSDRAFLQTLLEAAMFELRSSLYALSDSRYAGLRARHYRLLSFVPYAGIRISRMAESSGLTKQALTQAIAPLETGGYVEVVHDPSDRRARLLIRTPLGDEAMRAVADLEREHERAWVRTVGAQRWAVTRDVLAELFDRRADAGTST